MTVCLRYSTSRLCLLGPRDFRHGAVGEGFSCSFMLAVSKTYDHGIMTMIKEFLQ